MTETLLSMRNIVIEAGEVTKPLRIVDGVSLDLRRGEVLGLIGESGAGKSTLGLAAMGFTRDGCRITSGSVTFDNIELTKLAHPQLSQLWGRRMAYVAQSAAASFNPAHRLIDQYCEGPLWHKTASGQEAAEEARDLFRQMQLPSPQTIGLRYPHQVSGGQLQRAMTAMSMACHPDFMVFDEPTTALDVTTQIEVLAIIRAMVRQSGMAAIYITHDLALVAQMADRIKILRYGKEIEEQPTRAIMAAPREDYTKSLWAVRQFQKAAMKDTPKPPQGKGEPEPLFALDRVTAGYGPITILNQVSIKFNQGRTVAVVGESGSGKSTAARVLTGLLPARSGQILFNGKSIEADYRQRSKAELKSIQMIYQMADTALNPKQSVQDIIGRPAQFYLGLQGKALDEAVREILSLIELPPDSYRHRLPSELSGGQKQRVGIARALVAQPQLLICDEVTSALDQIVAEGILRLLDNLQRQFKLAMMFITHDLATVKAIADEVVVMQKGRVIEQGDKDDIFTPPHDPYTDLLLSSVPQMDADWLDGLLAKRARQA